jgi:hypothetical protein
MIIFTPWLACLPPDKGTYVGGPKNNENFFLEGRGALLLSAPAWCLYVTALHISWPSGVLEDRSIGSV